MVEVAPHNSAYRAEDKAFDEQRSAPRRRVLKSAKIVFDDWRAIDCIVRDTSETGAKIQVGGAHMLPHKFRLLMMSDNTIRPVQIAWKLNDTLGVAFRGPPEKATLRRFTTTM
jgi:PilZ domain